jgi:hypothetical protein
VLRGERGDHVVDGHVTIFADSACSGWDPRPDWRIRLKPVHIATASGSS